MKIKTSFSSLSQATALSFAALSTSATSILAAGEFTGISNPVINEALGSNPEKAQSGDIFTNYFIVVWRALIVVGALAVLFNLINGAIEWITAGGEASKVTHARQKMTNAVIGMIILAGSFSIIAFLGNLFGFDVLRLTIPTPGS
jgi:hypothetical protein